MQKRFFSFPVLLFVVSALYAQPSRYSHALYLEVATRAAPYSLNYEHTLSYQPGLTWALRAGISVTGKALAIPLGIHAYTNGSKHHFEASLALQPYVNHFKTMFKRDGKTDTYLYLVPGVGYRYQESRSKWFVRFALHPMLFMDPPSTNVFDVEPVWVLGGSAALGLRLE